MSELDTLILVLWLLYLAECLRWPAVGTTVFTSPWLRRWRITHAMPVLVRLRRSVYLANPLPPLGALLHCPRWPISLSPEGVCAWTAATQNPGARPEQPGEFARWEEIETTGQDGNAVRINGKPFLIASDAFQAHLLQKLLRDLRSMSASERAAAIDALLAARFDSAAVHKRVGLVRETSAHVRVLAHLLFFTLLAAGPASAYAFGLARVWPWWLALCVLWWLQLLIAFHRTHRELSPDAPSGAAFDALLTMILLPLAAIRAGDHIWMVATPQFEALAVARAVLPEAEFRRFSEVAIRDARHSVITADRPAGTPAAQTIEWFHARYVEQLEACARAAGLEPDALDRPPTQVDPEVQSYCPRCHNEFVITSGQCHLCGGIALRALPRRQAD